MGGGVIESGSFFFFSGDLLAYFLHLWASFLSPTYRTERGRCVFSLSGGMYDG